MVYPETELTEYKTSLAERNEIIDSVAAFATSGGGTIRIGFGPDGTRKGVRIGTDTISNLANAIKLATDPPQFPSITFEGDPESAVIVIKVNESPVKPVWSRGRPMKRVGDTSQVISPEEAYKLMERNQERSWDILTREDVCLGDIDLGAVKWFLSQAGQDTGTDAKDVLANLNLIRSGIPSNGAILLFGNNPQRFFDQAVVQCARFSGLCERNPTDFLDQAGYEGTVFDQVESTLAFVVRNTRQRVVITGKPQHDVVPEYPKEAVREAIINAVCHRDYLSTSTVQVRIFDDCLEVWNPGALPPDLTVEKLYERHRSIPRNPKIATSMLRAGLIERFGTGTLRIVRACTDAGLPKPEFESEAGAFVVRLQTTSPPAVSRVGMPLNERQRDALKRMTTTGFITTGIYAGLVGISRRQALSELTALVEAGIAVRVGAGRSAHYVLKSRTGLRD